MFLESSIPPEGGRDYRVPYERWRHTSAPKSPTVVVVVCVWRGEKGRAGRGRGQGGERGGRGGGGVWVERGEGDGGGNKGDFLTKTWVLVNSKIQLSTNKRNKNKK